MSKIVLLNSTAPGTPTTGKIAIYAVGDKVYSKDDNGVVHLLTQDGFGFNILIGDGLSAIGTGLMGFFEVPFDCEITSVRLFDDATGSIVIDLWKDTYANFPPTVADTITASAKPTISSGRKYEDSTLTGWTKTLTAGDVLAVNVDSASTVKLVTLSIRGKKT